MPSVRRAGAALVACCALAVAAPLAWAHGGQYLPPPAPTTGGGDLLPTTTAESDRVRTPSTTGHWSRWWWCNAQRHLAEDALDGRAAPTSDAVRTSAVDAVRKLVDDPNDDIATSAIIALAKNGDAADGKVALRALADAMRGPTVRESAALALGLLPAGNEVDGGALLATVKARDAAPRLRAFAAYALGLRKDASATPALSLLAEDPSTPLDVRAAAATALGLVGTADARLELAALVRAAAGGADEALVVRVHAAQGLAKCGGAEAVTALLGCLRDREPSMLRAAALALGEVAASSDDTVHRELVRLLGSSMEREVRDAAALAVGRQNHVRGRTTLEYAWRLDREGRPFVALGLGLLARRARDPERAALLRGAVDGSGAAAGVVGGPVNDDLRAAVMIGSALARDPAVLPSVRQAASSASAPTLRSRVAVCLALLRDRVQGPPMLREMLLAAKDPILLREAALAMGLLGDTGSVGLLVEAIRKHQSSFVRGEAAVALGRIGGAVALRTLTALLADESQPGLTRAMAVVGVGMLLDRHDGRGLGPVGEDLDWARLTPSVEEILTIL